MFLQMFSTPIFGLCVAMLLMTAGVSSGQVLRRSAAAVFSIDEVLQKHALWLQSNGIEGAKADLRGMSLEGAGLQQTEVLVGRIALNGVDLRQADFRTTKLRNVDFTGANLQDARFDQANLRWAILENADLRRANFTGANLQSVDFKGANLDQVNFVQADLGGADLTGARCLSRQQLAAAIL